jgi:3'-phosphoadenosine 5'-phosphosulfate sulfotransferase (PAPS reductase)/FAD synthetase
MLRKIVDAYDGELPSNLVTVFMNTGKEREETLRFVDDFTTVWGIPVHWLECRDGDPSFAVVDFHSAARAGEPFAALIAKKSFLPNAVTRFCTQELKIRPMRDFCRSLGFEHWQSVIGLRYDEGLRVMKALARNDANKDRFKAVMPLAQARVTKRDVMAFWAEQPFDLQLLPHEGNCDLCFLKSAAKKMRVIRDRPDLADWWITQEQTVKAKTPSGARFTTEYSYADLARDVAQSPMLPFVDNDDEHDAECGLLCAS